MNLFLEKFRKRQTRVYECESDGFMREKAFFSPLNTSATFAYTANYFHRERNGN